MSKKDRDAVFWVLIAVGSCGVSCEGLLHGSSPLALKDHTPKPQKTKQKTIFMQTNSINHQKSRNHTQAFCPLQDKCKYTQADAHSFIPDLQNVLNANESEAYLCARGSYD